MIEGLDFFNLTRKQSGKGIGSRVKRKRGERIKFELKN